MSFTASLFLIDLGVPSNPQRQFSCTLQISLIRINDGIIKPMKNFKTQYHSFAMITECMQKFWQNQYTVRGVGV